MDGQVDRQTSDRHQTDKQGRQTHKHTDRQTAGRQIDKTRQTHRHTDTDRQTDRQTHTHTHTPVGGNVQLVDDLLRQALGLGLALLLAKHGKLLGQLLCVCVCVCVCVWCEMI